VRKTAACALAALLIIPAAGATGEPPRVDAREISEGLYRLNGNGYDTNIGLLVGRDAAILIDPSPGEAQLDALNEVVRTLAADVEVFWIVNTHDHPDHAGGNGRLAEKGMRVVADGEPLPPGVSSVDVVSHSTRDRLLFLPDHNVVFVGDVFDNSWHPTFYAGGVEGLTDAVEKILAMGDAETLIVPGHGAPADKPTLRAFHRNTLDWVERLRALRARGYSVDRIMDDPEALEIVARFDTRGRDPFPPEAALRRFIERTLAVIAAGGAR
jgi:glyoxylase-like metal-dependent hydrolase (beta-lactamase superfamily II)